MNEQTETELERKDPSNANKWTAIVLISIAVLIAVMPFFYLRDVVFPG